MIETIKAVIKIPSLFMPNFEIFEKAKEEIIETTFEKILEGFKMSDKEIFEKLDEILNNQEISYTYYI